MMTCIKCKQEYSEANHECLEEVTIEELMSRGAYPIAGTATDLSDVVAKALAPFVGQHATTDNVAAMKKVVVDCLLEHQSNPKLTVAEITELAEECLQMLMDGGFNP